ncbi:MAG TPA: sigma-70 family RNA polymerase sigma factor [Candidatus Acidoferrales bacterium]|nr:sigma-70 family RNA polymerase sigma factor [Candidatus Acidoferrales bacterium]
MALRLEATSLRGVVARERLVAEYFYLCRRAARRFMRRGLDRSDLEQVGAIGLIKAADRYDSAQRAPFEAYAWILIVGELMHYVRDSERTLRAPRGIRDLDRKWSMAERALWERLGREPTESDVAQLMGATPGDVRELRAYRASSRVVPIDLLRSREHSRRLDDFDGVIDRLTVETILERLTPLQRKIVVSIHFYGVTVVELASRLGYSRRHVTRLHRTALERLKVAAVAAAER